MIKNTNLVKKFVKIYRNLQVFVTLVQNNDGFCAEDLTRDELSDSNSLVDFPSLKSDSHLPKKF